jgi:hypothetical protein
MCQFNKIWLRSMHTWARAYQGLCARCKAGPRYDPEGLLLAANHVWDIQRQPWSLSLNMHAAVLSFLLDCRPARQQACRSVKQQQRA